MLFLCMKPFAHNVPKETDQVLNYYFIMFVMFRIFDIWKALSCQLCMIIRFKNSFGVIILDDVVCEDYMWYVLVLCCIYGSFYEHK